MRFLQVGLQSTPRSYVFVDTFQICNYLEILYSPAICITKASIVLQLINIFAPTRSGKTYYTCLLLIVFNVLLYAAIMFIYIFGCSPRAKFWDPTTPGNCVNQTTLNVISGVFNSMSDMVIVLLPIVCVWQLQLSARQKVGVSAVFATALL